MATIKHGWLINIALLVAVALLTWLALRAPSREEAARTPLSAVKPAAVSRITLTRPARPAITIERRSEQWWMTAPFKARADEFQILRMLTILEAQPTAQLPATDRARFELEPPSAVLDIDGVQYAFGGINTVTREQYVLRGDTIHAVELRHGAGLPLNATALVRRALLAENEQPVAVALPEFTVSKNDGRWVLSPPSEGAGADELQRYVDQWRMASAATAEPYDQRPPQSDIRITLTDGSTLTMGVLQRQPQLVLWRRDNGLQYSFLVGAARSLLDKPGSAPGPVEKYK
ncbi:MAG: hypothetical protein RLZZ445_1918 [Pseudomonadota bacterium]